MRKMLFGSLACLFAVTMFGQTHSATPAPGPSGVATIVTAAEMKTMTEKDPPDMSLSDRLMTVSNINHGEYSVGVAIIHRGRPKGTILRTSLAHSKITEIYVILSGSATMIVGGSMGDVKQTAMDDGKMGPTFAGGPLQDGKSFDVDPGDVVVLPPNTPHYFSKIKSEEIIYECDRIDPQNMLWMPEDKQPVSTANNGQTLGQPGDAFEVKASEIQAAAEQTGPGVVQMLRVADINHGQYNIALALLHRTPKGDSLLSHNSITEIYHILSGKAIITTGGKIDNMKVAPTNSRIGPGFSGKTVTGGTDREVAPGDFVIIPPNTPHYYSKVESDKIVYLVVRVDPHHVLSMPPEDAAAAAAAAAR